MTDFKINGLVIKEGEIGENDKLLTVLTEKYGKIFVVGKGVKSVRSLHMATTQLFAYSSFTLRKRGNYYYISDSDLIENYYSIRDDILKLSLASFICDVATHVAKEGSEESSLLKLTLNTLYAISRNVKPLEIIRACFELRVISELGFMPDLSACRCCGEQNPEISCLDIMDGTIICDTCRQKGGENAIVKDSFYELGLPKPISIISLSVLAAMRYIIMAKSERFLSFSLGETEHPMLFDACEKYLLNQLERGFFSLDFYKSLL